MNDRAQIRAARKRKQAQAAAAAKLGAAIAPIAFARSAEDRHALDVNPNRAKRHASRAGGNVHSDPLGAQRERLTLNTGRRARGHTARTPIIATSYARIPALGETLSRRPLKP